MKKTLSLLIILSVTFTVAFSSIGIANAIVTEETPNLGYDMKTALKTTQNSSYVNTNVKAGTKYYYKARGYVTIDGKKYYTDYSKKTSITVSKKKMAKYTKPAPLYKNQSSIAGGYMAAKDPTITEELKAIFDKATKDLDGVAYRNTC